MSHKITHALKLNNDTLSILLCVVKLSSKPDSEDEILDNGILSIRRKINSVILLLTRGIETADK